MRGRVIRELRGSGGFGYDVLFEADEHAGVTTAELRPDGRRTRISHRGQALREIGAARRAPRLVAAQRAGGGTRTRTPEGTET